MLRMGLVGFVIFSLFLFQCDLMVQIRQQMRPYLSSLIYVISLNAKRAFADVCLFKLMRYFIKLETEGYFFKLSFYFSTIRIRKIDLHKISFRKGLWYHA